MLRKKSDSSRRRSGAGSRRTPRQERARQLVDAVLEATRELVSAAGFEALSTRSLAKRAGASVGSVYQYFAHREAILEAVFERLYEEAERRVDHIIDDAIALPVPEALGTLLDWYVGYVRRHKRLVVAATEHALRSAHVERMHAFEIKCAERLRRRLETEGHAVSQQQALVAVQIMSTLGTRIGIEYGEDDAAAVKLRTLDAVHGALGLDVPSPTREAATPSQPTGAPARSASR